MTTSMSHRPEKVREFIREQVSDILHHQVKDPRIGFVSVTEVEVSPDLRHARVFVSVLGDEQAKAQTLAGLHSALGFVRGELGRRLQMRFVPEITFRLDDSIERGTRVVSLIREVTGSAGGEDADERPGGADRGDAAGQP